MITPIEVTARYVTGENQPCTGKVTFGLSAVIRDVATGLIVDKEVDVALLDPTRGAASLSIYATDDPTDESITAVYHVTERIDGAPLVQYPMALPHASPGATLDLSSLG